METQEIEALEISKKTIEILDNYGLNFKLAKCPLIGLYNGENYNSNLFGILNLATNEIINSVKVGYGISQNDEIVELVNRGLDGYENLKIIRGGSLHGGRKIYLQLEISGNSIVGNDVIKKYVTVLSSNDGTASLSIGIGNETMSCENQFFHFYKKGNAKFRHTASLKQKMSEIPSLISLALSETIHMTNLYKSFEKTECSDNLVHGMVNNLVNNLTNYNKPLKKDDVEDLSTMAKNKMDSLYKNIYGEMLGDEGNNNQPKGKNLWGLFSGVTRWTTHEKSVPKRAFGRQESIICGTNYRTNHKALELVLNELNISLEKEGKPIMALDK